MNLSPGSRVTLTIRDLAFGGEGVACIDEFVIFVPFVIPGEEVEAEIAEVKKQFARARLVRVIKPSPARAAPPCPYFGECGGCQYQHIAYDEQLRLKHKQVQDLFERIGGFDRERITPMLPCPQPYGYRNRIMVRTGWNKPAQRLDFGFIGHDHRWVVDVEQCAIAMPSLNEQLREARAAPPPKGGLKVALRVLPEGWVVPPDSFFQNNFSLLPKLVDTVRNALRNGGARHLVDVYCGVGFFGIELARDVTSFVGVEYDRHAIRAARENATRHACDNGEFVSGLAEELLPELLAKFTPAATSVLLDPPRKGCAPEMLETLRSVAPAQIIYISCHPATMARDLKALCGEGAFELVSVTPLDMFPQTAHVECVANVRSRTTDH